MSQRIYEVKVRRVVVPTTQAVDVQRTNCLQLIALLYSLQVSRLHNKNDKTETRQKVCSVPVK